MLERGVTDEDIHYGLLNYWMTVASGADTELRVIFPNGRCLKIWMLGKPPPKDGVIIKSVAWVDEE